jgi:hypothetical protein
MANHHREKNARVSGTSAAFWSAWQPTTDSRVISANAFVRTAPWQA